MKTKKMDRFRNCFFFSSVSGTRLIICRSDIRSTILDQCHSLILVLSTLIFELLNQYIVDPKTGEPIFIAIKSIYTLCASTIFVEKNLFP